MSSDPILTEQQIEQLKNQQGGIEFGLGRRGSIDLNPAASAILGTITVDPIATLRDRILRQQGIIEEQTRGTNIDPAQYLKELEDALAAAGLDQQGNPIKEEVVDLNADTTASNIPAFDTTLDDTIPKETIESTSEPTPEQIYEENKKGTVFDLIDKYPTEDGGRYPVEFVVSILKNAANQGNANAAQILSNTPVAGPEGAFDGDGPAAGTGSAQQGTTGVGDLGDVLSGDDVVTPTNNTEPKVTGRRTEPKVEVATETIPPSTTPTVSTGSVLDQTGTGDVKVDDQPKGFLTGMTPQARAIINEGNRYDITATMLGPLIAKQDVPIISPLQFELDNVPQSNFAQALLTSDGLMRTLV